MTLSNRDLSRSALAVAALSSSIYLIPPIQLSFLPVPLTLQIMVVILIALLFPFRIVFLSILSYLVLGGSGLPIFSGAQAGITILFGPNGGFLWGFLVLGIFINIIHKHPIHLIYKMILYMATLVFFYYPLATLWLSVYVELAWLTVYLSMIPFIIVDIVKIVVAVIIEYRLVPMTTVIDHRAKVKL